MIIGFLEQWNPAFIMCTRLISESTIQNRWCVRLWRVLLRGWWKKIKDGWLNYLEKRKEAGEKGRMMSVWSRATPRWGIHLDFFDEARFQDISVSLSIWSDLVSTLLIRVSVFLPDLDNSSLSVSSYSSFGVTLLTSMPVIFDVIREDSPQQNFLSSNRRTRGSRNLLYCWVNLSLFSACRFHSLCLSLPSACHQTKFSYTLIARTGLRPYLFSNTTSVIWRNNTFCSHDPLAYLH